MVLQTKSVEVVDDRVRHGPKAVRPKRMTSASQLYRAGILIGLTEGEIIELVNSRFPGKGSEANVRWYWGELKRKRLNPPEVVVSKD